MPRSLLLIAALACPILLLTACAGQGDADATGSLALDAGVSSAPYLVLDLGTGLVTPRLAIADLSSNPTYRQGTMVFRRVPGGVGQLGENGSLQQPVEADEGPERQAQGGGSFLAVAETSRAQWALIAGHRPWEALAQSATGAGVLGGGDDSLPAVNLDLETVLAGLAAFRSRTGVDLALPGDAEWEHACRAGSPSLHWWGSATAVATVGERCVSAEGAYDQPLPILGRRPNPFGFHDMQGNVWELTGSGELRGGSWNDTLATCRISNRLPGLDGPHPLAGCRLVLRP